MRGAVGNVTRWFRHLFVAMCRRIRFGPSGVHHLFVLKLLQHHCSERSSVALLCKRDDLPGNETCCGRQLYVGDRTQVWRHGHTGFLWATYGIDGGTTEAVRASLLCAPSGPPCQRTGARVRDSQWPGRRNLPRRGTPRRAPVCCGGLMTPKTMTSRTPR